MCIITDGSETPLPAGSVKISDNHVSIVWKTPAGDYFKRSTPYLISNEFAFLHKMDVTGYAPTCTRLDKYTLLIEGIEKALVTDIKAFWLSAFYALDALKKASIRHGNLTPPHVLPTRDNGIALIDFAEARWVGDPAAPKRPESDFEQMKKTVLKILAGYSSLRAELVVSAYDDALQEIAQAELLKRIAP